MLSSLIIIIPKSQRARNRVHEHGKIMKILEVRDDRFLVESLNDTHYYSRWEGWFVNEEASYERIKG